MTILEVCIDTPEGLTACEKGGADRIELCAALGLGGLTPSAGLMQRAAQSDIPAHAMIRPVAGGFVLTDAVMATMLEDIATARRVGLAGVVIGALTPDDRLDDQRLSTLIIAAGDLEVTLHRAIDLCPDPVTAVEQAVALGVHRILTSGGARTAYEGRAAIARMVAQAKGAVTVMAGSGITPQNAADIVAATGVSAVHASCTGHVPEDAEVAAFGFGPAQRPFTDPNRIAALRVALGRV